MCLVSPSGSTFWATSTNLIAKHGYLLTSRSNPVCVVKKNSLGIFLPMNSCKCYTLDL